jgi:hypothetical protein
VKRAGTIDLDSPHCGLTVTPRAHWLTVTIARLRRTSRVIVSLFVSTLPANEPRPTPGSVPTALTLPRWRPLRMLR